MAGKLRKVAGTVAGAATGAAAFGSPVVAGINQAIHEANHSFMNSAAPGHIQAAWDANLAGVPAIAAAGGALVGGIVGHHLATRKHRALGQQFK